jgi:hypothetical protein
MAEQKAKAPVFEKGDLIKAAADLGTTPELMAGALHKVEKPISLEEAKKLVDAFTKKPLYPEKEAAEEKGAK